MFNLEKKPWKVVFMEHPAKEYYFLSFNHAFAFMYDELKERMKTGMSQLAFDQGIWLEHIKGYPMFWPEARDAAYDRGLMKDGKMTKEINYIKLSQNGEIV
jgi:hypothetical protein